MKSYTTGLKKVYDCYEASIKFHGHSCPGLAIGVRAAIEAQRILKLDFSNDEELVCVAENDACGIDGIQAILGCSVGKGNLIFHMRGKQAFNIYNRSTGESVRLILKERSSEIIDDGARRGDEREAKIRYILEAPFDEVFMMGKAKYPLPEEARIFQSYMCESCGERTAESHIRLEAGKKLCLDCVSAYHRV